MSCFKPYYKWNTFNTYDTNTDTIQAALTVLNLIINGIPSILGGVDILLTLSNSFKPYYKWNTFNTIIALSAIFGITVLNLIINGIPSIL